MSTRMQPTPAFTIAYKAVSIGVHHIYGYVSTPVTKDCGHWNNVMQQEYTVANYTSGSRALLFSLSGGHAQVDSK